MQPAVAFEPVPIVVHRSPTFTLGTALAWLGHACAGGCPAQATECRAAVWFVYLPRVANPTWTRTLVNVAFAERPAADDVGAMLREVNLCVRPNRIRVRERSQLECESFVAALAARHASV